MSGPGFYAWIGFDDSTPHDEAPFRDDPSLLSLCEDHGLTYCCDYRFFSALGYSADSDPSETRRQPLFELRGYRDFSTFSYESRQLLEIEEFVGWLTASEVFAAISHHSLAEDELAKPVQVLLGLIRYLCTVFGEDRVLMEFVFIP